MIRTRYILPALILAFAAVIGCQRTQTALPVASTGADKTLEVKIARMDADLKKASDEIAKLTNHVKQQEARGKELEREREDLKLTVKERTAERDVVASKLDGFRKSVKDLLGQMEAASAQPFKPSQDTITMLQQSLLPTTKPVQ